MERPWLYGKGKVSVFFKDRVFGKLYRHKKKKKPEQKDDRTMIKKCFDLILWIIGKVIFFILIIIDKLANVLLLGSPHKTISMRLGFATNCEYVVPRWNWVVKFAKFVDILFHNRIYSLEENHIHNSYEAEEMLSSAIIKLYKVLDQENYDKLKEEVTKLRTKGRKPLKSATQ